MAPPTLSKWSKNDKKGSKWIKLNRTDQNPLLNPSKMTKMNRKRQNHKMIKMIKMNKLTKTDGFNKGFFSRLNKKDKNDQNGKT